jgi:hypothetical protein
MLKWYIFFANQLMKRSLSLLLFLLLTTPLMGQIRGKVFDQTQVENVLSGANVSLHRSDSSLVSGTVSDTTGRFFISQSFDAGFLLRVSFLGYDSKWIVLEGNETRLRIGLNPGAVLLNSGEVKDLMIRVEQQGDTTLYRPEAYKTNPDATVEQLLTKMPGFGREQGRITAQGEVVQRVLIDGQEYFGEDATLALQNLNADIVKQIQVYDRASDQSRFSGFDDGNHEKTINIVTREGLRNSNFGRVYAGYGYGDEHRVRSGGNVQMFRGDRRLSVISMANNTNQQNFSSTELQTMGGELPQNTRRGRGGSSSGNDFMIGPQGGINRTASVGIHFQENREKIKFSGSVFSNFNGNEQTSRIDRTNFLPGGITQNYNESLISSGLGHAHRTSMRIEIKIDSLNTLIYTPRGSFQASDQVQSRNSVTLGMAGDSILRSINSGEQTLSSWGMQHQLLYNHSFRKPRRTFSMLIGQEGGQGNSGGILISESLTEEAILLERLNQNRGDRSNRWRHYAQMTYTEPFGSRGGIEINSRVELGEEKNERNTLRYDSLTTAYTDTDTLLSNYFELSDLRVQAGAAYRYQHEKLSIMGGFNAEHVSYGAFRYFPGSLNVMRSFLNFLPRAMLSYRINQETQFRFFYRARATNPSLVRMQDLLNNLNPMLLNLGNPNLNQELSHRFFCRLSMAKKERGRNFSLFIRGQFTEDFIARSTLILSSDSVFSNGIMLPKGTQYSSYENMDGYAQLNFTAQYGIPIIPIKSNLNLSSGMNWQDTPGRINGLSNMSRTLSTSGGFTLSSNISERYDFTLQYNGSYHLVFNRLQPNLNNHYYSHTLMFSSQIQPYKGIIFGNSVGHTLYYGLSDNLETQFLLWNMALGYKFLKNSNLDVRITLFDLLGQNNSLGREVTETFIEDSETNALRRYLMVSLTWNFKQTIKPMPLQAVLN